jgi:hypothetical protein
VLAVEEWAPSNHGGLGWGTASVKAFEVPDEVASGGSLVLVNNPAEDVAAANLADGFGLVPR